jgi:MYXO-CTERM domain-containing protein
MRTRWKVLALASCAAMVAQLWHQSTASACGCIAPPDPTVPVVQAGERILFSVVDGEVTAHIQIQYAGGGEFGWILPLPTVPTLDLGTDELFAQLTQTTQPKYRLDRTFEGNCGFGNQGGPPVPAAGGADDGQAAPPSDPGKSYNPLVYQDSVGPYDYAVLKADRKDEMIQWLNDNHYFIPTGTGDAVDPYIRPGAYFLALKLKSGSDAGDIQPVVLKYQSDLPMIPIVLTSVAAQPDMGIQVWMLGEGRAIPRNYHHTVINDAKIDWISAGQNYNDVIIAATKEAPERHTFVTEFAGASTVMQKLLNYDGRFGTTAELALATDEVAFVDYLNSHGYAYTSQLVGILSKYIPLPAAVAAQGVDLAGFYQGIDYWLGDFRTQNPADFTSYAVDYQPQMMADEIEMRVVAPTLAAGALFDQQSYLTRLYTTLSPEQMTDDPVFSYNPTLPDFSNTHSGSLTYHCGFGGNAQLATTPATLVTESGWRIYFPTGTGEQSLFPGSGAPAPAFDAPAGPYSQRIETLAEEGPPSVEVDNSGRIRTSLNADTPPPGGGTTPSTATSGCSVASGPSSSVPGTGLGVLLLLVGVLVHASRRRPPRT